LDQTDGGARLPPALLIHFLLFLRESPFQTSCPGD
jgi:hypothetical protein